MPVAAASCGAELSYLSCEAITWNVSTGIRFPYLCWRSARLVLLPPLLLLPKTPSQGAVAREGVYMGHLPRAPFRAPAAGTEEKVWVPGTAGSAGQRGSSLPRRYNRNGARAFLHTRLSVLKRELRACSGTSSPPAHKHRWTRRGTLGGLGWELWPLGKVQK